MQNRDFTTLSESTQYLQTPATESLFPRSTSFVYEASKSRAIIGLLNLSGVKMDFECFPGTKILAPF